jgi:rod shape-determining protein MreC
VNLRSYRDILIVLLALAVPFAFLRASMRDPAKQASGADRLLMRVAAPIQYASATLARGVSNLWGDYVYLIDVKEDNRSLASQNARLLERVHKLENLEAENRRLRRLLELRQNMRLETITAQVIAKDTSDFFRVVRVELDKDTHDIQPNLPVVSSDGVVGITQKSSKGTVDVRLVVDAGDGVAIVVQRTGAHGFVRGAGADKYTCKIEDMQRTDEVEVGDLLVTSGFGHRFPKGLPVATVTQVIRREFGNFQEVIATPTVDFSRLEEVLIITSVSPEEAPSARDAKGAAQRN